MVDGKLLLVVTTYNQLKYTKICIRTIKNTHKLEHENIDIDLVAFDDCSTDETVNWLKENDVSVITKEKAAGLTDSWNNAYKYFKEHEEYKYLIIANNDIIIPKGAINELVDVMENWPFSTVVPLSTKYGAGHNGDNQGVEKIYQNTDIMFVNNPNNCQAVQDKLLAIKTEMNRVNNGYMLDPVRRKMFNGFFFLMNRNVINYEYDNGTIFDDTKPLYKAEDEFNWMKLIPNNDFVALCQTAFVFHFKGVSTVNFGEKYNTNKTFEKRRQELEEREDNGNN